MKYTEWLNANWEKDNMFPPCLDPQKSFIIFRTISIR